MKIRLLALDCDGVLTDGTFLLDAKGLPVRRFHYKDIMGLSLAQRSGIRIAILTAEPITKGLLAKLDIRKIYSSVKYRPDIIRTRDKARELKRLAKRYGLATKEVAMIGDDVNDIPAMQWAGFSACPKDANSMVRQNADYVCKALGGYGAVREVCEYLIRRLKRG